MDLNLSVFGWLHSTACLVAMAAFVMVLFRRKGTRFHRKWGQVFVLSYVAVCLTSLAIYKNHLFWFPHWLAVAGLVVVGIGWAVARWRVWGWRYIHAFCMLLSAYNLFGGAVNEAYLRISFLHALAGGDIQSSPLVGMTHGMVMMIFILLIVGYLVAAAITAPRRAKASLAGSGD